jgi:hypothetical protein
LPIEETARGFPFLDHLFIQIVNRVIDITPLFILSGTRFPRAANLAKLERMPFLFIQHRFMQSSGVATTATTLDDETMESSSIFSEPEWNLYTTKKQSKTYATARDRWEHLRRNFIKRDMLLARLTSSKSTAFRRQLMQRERIVRQRAVERLLTKCSNERQRNEMEKEIAETYKFRNLLAEEEDTTSSSPIQSWANLDAWTFEMNSSVPAVLALLIHTAAHSGIDGSVGFLTEELAQWMSLSWRTKQTLTLMVGLLLMRLTGDLYWWARDPIYDTVKFDYHNRKSLGYRDAWYISKIRTKKALRATLFMIGFYLTYGVATNVFLSLYRSFLDERSSILGKLPSFNYRNHVGVCPAANDESFCSNSCQNEIQRHGKLCFAINLSSC